MSATAVQREVKERPIIFGAESICAILVGRKTQTRRAVKAKHADPYLSEGKLIDPQAGPLRCPYGEPGDRLWVRERFALYNTPTDVEREQVRVVSEKFFAGYYSSVVEAGSHLPRYTGDVAVLYAADFGDFADAPDCDANWKSPLFLKHEHARITLEITGVRAERLQDISEADAEAEGAQAMFEMDVANFVRGGKLPPSTYRNGYRFAWNELNKARGLGWDTNPFVWVVTFQRVEESAR